jgi:hypothetical protein
MRVSGLRHAPPDLSPGKEWSVANEKKDWVGLRDDLGNLDNKDSVHLFGNRPPIPRLFRL